ncbi:unnamed protein product [Closterium sp. NIES-54]
MVTTTTPGGQRVSICMCTRTGRHLATFTHRSGSSLYTLTAEPPHTAASGQVSASGPITAPCSCRLLSHQTLLWHHRLGHPSLPPSWHVHSPPCFCSFSGLCLPSHPRLPRPAFRASRGGSTLLLTPRFPRQLLPCRLSTWTCCLQLRERFHEDLSVPPLHSDRGVMEVARTSMIHAAAPHFLWPFALRYAAHQLNLWLHLSLPETSHTLRWTGKVGDESVFRVWGSRAFVRDTSTDKLSSRAIPYVFLGFPPDAPGWQFYHPTSRRVRSSQDVTFDESVPFYCLFPYRTAPPSPPAALPRSRSPSDSGVARGAASGGAEPAGAEPGGSEPTSAEPWGAEPEGAEPGGAEREGTKPGGASPRQSHRREPLSPQQLRECFARCTRLRSGAAGARGPATGGLGAGGAGATSPGGAGVTDGAGGTGGAGAAGPGGARTRDTRFAGAGGVGGAGAGDPGAGGTGAGGAGAGDPGAGDRGVGGAGGGGPGAGDPRAGDIGAGDPGARGPGAGGGVAGGAGAGGTGA